MSSLSCSGSYLSTLDVETLVATLHELIACFLYWSHLSSLWVNRSTYGLKEKLLRFILWLQQAKEAKGPWHDYLDKSNAGFEMSYASIRLIGLCGAKSCQHGIPKWIESQLTILCIFNTNPGGNTSLPDQIISSV